MITPVNTRYRRRIGMTPTRTLLDMLATAPADELRTYRCSAWMREQLQDISRERGTARRREVDDPSRRRQSDESAR